MDNLLKFVQHDHSCDFLQPMWHQGPCDCGLFSHIDQLALDVAQLTRLSVQNPDLVLSWRHDRRKRAEWAAEKQREDSAR